MTLESIPETVISVASYAMTAIVSAIAGWWARKSKEQKTELISDVLEAAPDGFTIEEGISLFKEHVLNGEDDDK